ncbi:MAG: tetratricopeptide repeat protein [Chloroflexi bacterium]|nr:tetratricopeptide repeat protein [Chloroflexota bacterium]
MMKSQKTLRQYSQMLVAKILSFLGYKTNAIMQLEKIIQEWPEDYNLLLFALHLHRNEENWEEYLKLYAQFEKFHAGDLFYNRHFGSILLEFGHYEEAAVRLKYCVENWDIYTRNDFERNVTLARLAVCYINLGMLNAASNAIEKVSEKKPWNADVIYARLLFKIAASQSETIPGFLDEQITKYPWLPCLYYWKGQYVRDYLHNSQEAYQLFEAALERTNYLKIRSETIGNGFGGEFYANSYSMLQSAVAAYMQSNKNNIYKILWLVYLTKLKTLNSFIDTRAMRIYILIEENLFAKAEEECKKALNKLEGGKASDYWTLLALAQNKMGKLDEGFASAKQAITLNQYNDEALNVLGDIQLLQHDWTSAIQTYKEIIKSNPYDFEAWKRLGVCYINIKDFKSAQSSFEKTIQINPSEADAWVDLGDIYMKSGNNDLALSAYQNGLKYSWLDKAKKQTALLKIKN